MRAFQTTVILAAALSLGSATARTLSPQPEPAVRKLTWDPELLIAFDAGTTGIGFQLECDMNSMLRVRTGFDWMPRFEYPMHFSVQVGDGEPDYDDLGRSKFDRMSGYLEEMTGFQIDQQIDMIGVPHFHNFKLLLDVKPFNDRRWYFTGGFYMGPSLIGRAYNRTEDMTTLMCVSMYNQIWWKVDQIENHDNTELDGVFLGMELPPDINSRILNAGRMGMRVGDFKDGTPYIMEPDENNMVKAEMKVNSFKPYLGAGYSSFRTCGQLGYSIDAGMLFWGGSPKVYTHEGVEIVNGIDNVIGQVGRYTRLVKPLKVFPVVNISVIYSF